MFAVFIFWTLFVLVTFLPVALVLRLIFGHNPPVAVQTLARRGICLYGWIMLFLMRPCLPIHKKNYRIPLKHQPCIIVCNHQSFLDIYLISAQAETNICLVSKAWPYRVLFFFAPMMRLAGYINIENADLEASEALCLQRLQEGASLVFFPEGRRTRDGTLGRFHAGAFVLACKAHVPVIPMIFYNSYDVFAPHSRCFTPQTIHIRVLDPIYPEKFAQEALPHRALLRHVHGEFAKHLVAIPQLTSPAILAR